MLIKSCLVLICISVLPVFSFAQKARSATCALRPLWISKDRRIGSGTLPVISQFIISGKEGMTVKSFKYQESELILNVGIYFAYEYSRHPQRPYRISMGINVSNKELENLFEQLDTSEAETLFQKKWNLQVKRSVLYDNRIYQFYFQCWDNGK
jgi:hypothetical protein